MSWKLIFILSEIIRIALKFNVFCKALTKSGLSDLASGSSCRRQWPSSCCLLSYLPLCVRIACSFWYFGVFSFRYLFLNCSYLQRPLSSFPRDEITLMIKTNFSLPLEGITPLSSISDCWRLLVFDPWCLWFRSFFFPPLSNFCNYLFSTEFWNFPCAVFSQKSISVDLGTQNQVQGFRLLFVVWLLITDFSSNLYLLFNISCTF